MKIILAVHITALYSFLCFCLIPGIYMQVVSANKGGVVAVVEGLRGFVPFSQISSVSSYTWFVHSCLTPQFSWFVPYGNYMKKS